MRSYYVIETIPGGIDPVDGHTGPIIVEHVVVRAASADAAIEQVRNQLEHDGLLHSTTTFTVKAR